MTREIIEGWPTWFSKIDLLNMNLFITAHCPRAGQARRDLKALLATYDVEATGGNQKSEVM